MTRLALAGAALAGGQAIAQTIPKTTPENLAAAPIKAPLAVPTPAASSSPVPLSEQPLALVPIEPSSAPQAPPRARPTTRAISAPRREPALRPNPRVTPPPVIGPVATASPAAPVTQPAPAPTVAPVATPSASPAIAPTPEPEIGEGLPGWLLPAGLGSIAALVAAFMAWRRRGLARAADREIEVVAETQPAPLPVEPPVEEPAPAVTPIVPDAPQFLERPAPSERAWIDLALPLVHRAGLNLVTATADVALVVRNEGEAPARSVRVAIRLTSAQPGQDAVLDALFAEPIERPVVPPFDLAPGAERAVRGIATLSREAIVALEAAGRPMFVPVVALSVLYDVGGGSPGQTTAAFAVGIERGEGGKLGPLWLDEPSRMHDAIGIRAHGTTVKR